jgi:hypothetical protein
VTTETSVYLLDLDAKRVTRVPDAGRRPSAGTDQDQLVVPFRTSFDSCSGPRLVPAGDHTVGWVGLRTLQTRWRSLSLGQVAALSDRRHAVDVDAIGVGHHHHPAFSVFVRWRYLRIALSAHGPAG